MIVVMGIVLGVFVDLSKFRVDRIVLGPKEGRARQIVEEARKALQSDLLGGGGANNKQCVCALVASHRTPPLLNCQRQSFFQVLAKKKNT